MKYLLVILPLLLIASLPATSQSIKPLIDTQNYVFQVQTAQPLRGSVRQLSTYNYTLKITKDKITSDLPYFGRAYVAPIDASQTGLQFATTKFTYTLTPGRKEGWIVSIKPQNALDIRELQLTIGTTGYATLQVTCTNRDPITFQGVIAVPR